METPPREPRGGAGASASSMRQVQARLKMQMQSEMEVDAPEMERMGDEAPVHTSALRPLADDFDDDDLD
jgi:hypothetical protein